MSIKTVLVTGGAGYVGAVLVPQLLKHGYDVRLLDLYVYGGQVLDGVGKDPGLKQIKGDIRDQELLKVALFELLLEVVGPGHEVDVLGEFPEDLELLAELVLLALVRRREQVQARERPPGSLQRQQNSCGRSPSENREPYRERRSQNSDRNLSWGLP